MRTKDSPTVVVTVSLPKKLHRRTKEFARRAARTTSVSKVVTLALEDFMRERGRKPVWR